MIFIKQCWLSLTPLIFFLSFLFTPTTPSPCTVAPYFFFFFLHFFNFSLPFLCFYKFNFFFFLLNFPISKIFSKVKNFSLFIYLVYFYYSAIVSRSSSLGFMWWCRSKKGSDGGQCCEGHIKYRTISFSHAMDILFLKPVSRLPISFLKAYGCLVFECVWSPSFVCCLLRVSSLFALIWLSPPSRNLLCRISSFVFALDLLYVHVSDEMKHFFSQKKLYS